MKDYKKELDRAEKMLENYDFAEAEAIADSALVPAMKVFPSLSRAAVIKGKVLMKSLLGQYSDAEQNDPSLESLRVPYGLFSLASELDSDNEEAAEHATNMQTLLKSSPKAPKEHNHSEPLDVVIVGAGASGVGVAVLMTKVFGLDNKRVLLIERGDGVGETFKQWPKEMRFISPSFNHQGWTNSFDLNSIAHGTSPAYTLFSEHPTGQQYAEYLHQVARANELNVRANTEASVVRRISGKEGFEVDVLSSKNAESDTPETLRCRYVVWAAGEFQYARASKELFPGSDLCLHNSKVRSWGELKGDNFVIIGGHESGMDAACNLSSCGKHSTVISSTAYWNVTTDDPSTELAPYTAQRVRDACSSSSPPRLFAPLRVHAVEKVGGEYVVHAKLVECEGKENEETVGEKDSEVVGLGQHRVPLQTVADQITTDNTGTLLLRTKEPPLLCTGFQGSVFTGVVKDLFEWGLSGSVHINNEKVGNSSKKRKRVAMDKESGNPWAREFKEGEGQKSNLIENDGCQKSSPLLSECDESTITPGLFLVGPAVRHDKHSFCFVYKFRQRFGVVAEAIARGLGFTTDIATEDCREMNMFLDDFSCCQAACGETC